MADTWPTIPHDHVMARARCDRSRCEATEARLSLL
ncbi:hypothetical protein [Xanthomonas fragariae]